MESILWHLKYIRVGDGQQNLSSVLIVKATTGADPHYNFRMAGKVLELGTFVETNKDGVQLKFKVTTIPEEIHEDVVNHMVTYFLPREPLCAYGDVINNPTALEAARTIFREIIKQGNAMVALAEKPGPLKDRIVGANITYVTYKGKPSSPPENSEMFKNIYKACEVAAERANLYGRYGIDRYLSAFGLSVDPKYHGFRIGERILECRKPLCQHLGVKATGTIFTAAASQYLSRKVGFQVLYEEEYSKYKRDDGKLFFEKLPGKFEYNALSY